MKRAVNYEQYMNGSIKYKIGEAKISNRSIRNNNDNEDSKRKKAERLSNTKQNTQHAIRNNERGRTEKIG